MDQHKTDDQLIKSVHNTARFCVENRHIAWVILLGVIIWGIFGYLNMPKGKDPQIPVRVAVAICPWPGVSASKVEQQVTRKLENAIAENKNIHKPKPVDYGLISTSLPSVSIVHIQLADHITETQKEFDDIKLKLNAINDLPKGAGPIQLVSSFGDTATLMLTVASPKQGEVELALRARDISQAISQVRKQALPDPDHKRISLVQFFPASESSTKAARLMKLCWQMLEQNSLVKDAKLLQGSGFVGFDVTALTDYSRILAKTRWFLAQGLGQGRLTPGLTKPVLIKDPAQSLALLRKVAPDKYSHRDLENYTDLIMRILEGIPLVSRVARYGVLPQAVYLEYSQDQLATNGLKPYAIKQVLAGRNITPAAGAVNAFGQEIAINPTGQFSKASEIKDVMVGVDRNQAPLYLRDLVDVSLAYQDPVRYLNYHTFKDKQGNWQRTAAVTIAVYMREGEQVGEFGRAVNKALPDLMGRVPHDLLIVRTSDQSKQTEENTHLFMMALFEAVILVILVAWLSFWEWRAAVVTAISIPLTLAMTFGLLDLLGIDLQTVSNGALIVALGLLVDDPVVATDAIKRSQEQGLSRLNAAWIGPTRLAKAILFATITNIVAYLPFFLLTGNTGQFLYSLPVVMTCALVSSRVVSMTFVPLLGFHLLKPSKKPEPTIEERRQKGFSGFYYRLGEKAINHRWVFLGGALVILVVGGIAFTDLKTSFFPKDLQNLFYVDVWLPNGSDVTASNKAAVKADKIIREVCAQYGQDHPDDSGKPRKIIKCLTTFVGGGGPRFWISVSPQVQQTNYSQIVVELFDKHDTPALEYGLQKALSSNIPGGLVDVNQLQINPVAKPVSVHLSCRADLDDSQGREAQIQTLRTLARKVKEHFQSIPQASRVRESWGNQNFQAKLLINADRAILSGLSNEDVANSFAAGLSGITVTTLQKENKLIPVLARLRPEERANLSSLENIYVYASRGPAKVPMSQVASLKYDLEDTRIKRREHFPTITIWCYPAPGELASTVFNASKKWLAEFKAQLPPGFELVIGGERAKQQEGFKELSLVMAISVMAIFLALVIQFNHVVKPFIVFAAVPFGFMGSIAVLVSTQTPFGFMAFLGIASLVGVIVSHVIVLFDMVEVMHEKGEPLKQALLDAGIMRMRPVVTTVLATVLALFPLTIHGGPLWQPLCYAQIGGLFVATFVTLLLVPVLYSIFVLDLKLVKWTEKTKAEE